MNYYEHHLGDYAEATMHLSLLEDAVYSRLIRKYYATELPIPVDEKAVQRLVGARTAVEREAVKAVLAEFFILQDDGWHNARCDQELARYLDKQAKAKRSANARWSASPSHTNGNANAMRTHAKSDANALPTQCEGNALQSPVSSLQSKEGEGNGLNGHSHPVKAKQRKSSRVPPDFNPDVSLALAKLPDLDPEREVAKFRDWEFKSPRSDWPAVWRNWVESALETGRYAKRAEAKIQWR